MRAIQRTAKTSTSDVACQRGRRALLSPVILALAILGVLGAGPWAAEVWGCADGHDTWETALDLGSSCGDTQAAIDCVVDQDYYTFSPPTSGTYTVQSLGPTPVQVYLQDSSHNTLGYNDSGGPIQHVLTAGLTYYVAIFDDTYGSTGPYTLRITGCNASCGTDPGDNDTGHATELSGCGSRSAAIDCAGDYDFYSLVAPNSGSFTFETTGSTDTYLTLYDGVGSVIALDDDSGAGSNGKIVHSLVAGDWYYLAVNEYNNDGTGDYTLVVSGCAPACGADPGNDTRATATALRSGCGDLTGKAIDCAGDIDFYSWTAATSGTYTFAVTPTSTMRLTLFTAAGSLIAEGPSVTHTMSAGEKVLVRIMSQSPSDTPSYTLSITGCTSGCGNDPGNDYLGSATPLSGCGSTAAAIDCTGDLDYYWLTAPNSGSFTFETTGTTDTELRLYDANGDVIASDDDSGAGSNAKIVSTLTAGQKYSVAVNEYNNDATGDYTLEISGCSGGSCGADPGNDTTGTATSLGSSCGTTSARIDCTGDVDFYAFTAPNGGAFTFDVGALSTYNITLYSDTGSLLEGPSGSALAHTLSAGQLVYARVMAGADGNLLDYSLVISGCSGGGCGADPGNDDLGSATDIGSSCSTTAAAIDCVGDVDFYSFVAPTSAEYVIQTTGLTDTQLTLYDATGGIIAADDNSGNGNNAFLQQTLTAGQIYKIQVSESGNDGTGDYTLQIDGCSSGGCGNDPGNDDFSLATDIGSSCGTTSAAIDCDTDMDFYTFTATADTVYTFAVSSAGGLRFELWTGGQQVGGGTTSTTLPMTPGEPVTIIVIRDGGTAPISYDLTISGCSSGGCGNDPGDDDIAHAIDLGSSCTTRAAAIDCASDVDVYRFSVPSDGVYTYSAIGSHDTYVYLMDSAGKVVSQTGNSIVQNETAGTLRYFRVAPITTNDAPFDYTLSIAGCSSGSCGNDPGNDDRDHATNLGTGVGTWPAAIDCPGDLDVYTFTAPQTANYTIMTTGATDTWIEIADSAVIATDDNSGQATNASLTADLSAGTKYFVTVKEASGNNTGNYELAIAGSQGGTVYTYIVPATAKITGLSGTDWRSDLSIVNTKWSAALITIEAWLRDQANPSPAAVTRVIDGGAAFNMTDLLGSLFGFGSGSSAALKITSDTELAVSTRTYNLTANGTYGQYIPGRDLAASFQAGETAYLQGFREDAQARSNLGLVNVADVTNNITVTFYGADGAQLGSPRTYAVPAHGFIQKTRVLREVSSNPVELAWARLTAADGPFVGYLSLIDAASGDPTFRPTMAASTESSELILPGIAKVHGASATNWVSDMVLLNTTSGARQVSVELWVRDQANGSPQTRTVTLAARECRRLEDVLPGLFGMGKGAAAFRITAGAGVIVDARTFNQVSSGSYGQYVPAMYRIQGIFSTRPGLFPMVSQNTGYRTNLGLVNGDSGAVDVTISLLDESGTVVGTPITVQLADRAVTQIDRIVNRFTSNPFSGGYLKLEVPSSFANHPVHAFVTVVDQKTGDPVYLTPAATQP